MQRASDRPGLEGGRGRKASRGLRRFRRDNAGASALEFALVAGPLILLLLAILNVGVAFFANFTLENAAAQGARLIRTGQAQNQGFDATAFKNEVCKHLGDMLSCAKLQVDVRRFDDFGSSQLTNPLDGQGNLKSNFSYEPGAAGEVVVVRTFYPWDLPSLLPSIISMSNMANNQRLLVATAAFRNEPFPDEAAKLGGGH